MRYRCSRCHFVKENMVFCEHCGQTTHKLNEVMDRPVAKSLVEVVQRDQSIPIVEMKQ